MSDEDFQSFVSLLKTLQSNDNVARPAAEKQYEVAKTGEPKKVAVLLLRVLATTEVEGPVKEQAAVLLRQLLVGLQKEASFWWQLDAAGKSDMQAALLQLLQAEENAAVRNKIGACVTLLGKQLCAAAVVSGSADPYTAWPDLLPTVCKIGQQQDASSQEAALRVLCDLTDTFVVRLMQAPEVGSLISTHLQSSSPEVLAWAAQLVLKLVSNAEDPFPMQPCVGQVMEAIGRLCASGSSSALDRVLPDVVDAIEEAGEFFAPALTSSFLPAMSGVANNTALSDDTRTLGLEVLVSFAEHQSKIALSAGQYVAAVVEICVKFALTLTEDEQAWAASDEDSEQEPLFSFSREASDRICTPKPVREASVLLFQEAVTKLLQAGSDWRSHVACLTILAQVVEYVDDDSVVLAMLERAVLPLLVSSHCRVRHAAWIAMAQFAQDHGEILEAHAGKILELFDVGFVDSVPRVSLVALDAFVHYGGTLDQDSLSPFLPSKMEFFVRAIQESQARETKERCILAVSVCARQSDEAFLPYFEAVMAMLKQVLSTATKPEDRVLLGKTVECISVIAAAVGRRVFAPEAAAIVAALVAAVQSSASADDPVKEYALSAAERICITLKEDFKPFVPAFLPFILDKLSITPVQLESTAGVSEDMTLTLMVTGEANNASSVKLYGLKTSEMEDMKNAAECLHTFVDQMSTGFAEYIGTTVQSLRKVFDFELDEQIRQLAFATWAKMCNIARSAGAMQDLSLLVTEFLNVVLVGLGKEDESLGARVSQAAGVASVIRQSGPGVLSTEQVGKVCGACIAVIGGSIRRVSQMAPRKDEDEDEDEQQEMMEWGVQEQTLEVLGAVMEHYPDEFVGCSLEAARQTLVEFHQLASAGRRKAVHLKVLLAVDLVHYLGPRVLTHWPDLIPIIMDSVPSQDMDVRQAAAYGLIHAARRPEFAELAPKGFQALVGVVQETRGGKIKKTGMDRREWDSACDNALAALLELLVHHQASLQADEGWKIFVDALPLRVDEEEAVRVHKQVLHLMQSRHEKLLGPQNGNLVQLVRSFASCYTTERLDDEGRELVNKMMCQIPEQWFSQHASEFNEKQQKRIQKIVSKAS
mmetsp:Transcript_62529/g.167479  ORF Transcript_62529/g.167479 Transcript_62529/m.167479 type:complete len:1100 (+) Transcript_62529:67-3366(+)